MNQTIRRRDMRRAGPASEPPSSARPSWSWVSQPAAARTHPGWPASGRQSGGGSAASSSSVPASPLAFSRCMRAHGLPNFPDPGSDGQVPKTSAQQLGVSSTQLMSAQRACQPLLPDTGGSLATSLRQCEEQGALPAGDGAAGDDATAEVLPMHALARDPEMARPGDRCAGEAGGHHQALAARRGPGLESGQQRDGPVPAGGAPASADTDRGVPASQRPEQLTRWNPRPPRPSSAGRRTASQGHGPGEGG